MTNMERIYDIQRGMQKKFRGLAPEGVLVDYLGKDHGMEFKVYPTVFWPSWDSQALVKNYAIGVGETSLDLCTGSGVIAIFSALRGAEKVVAVDINPQAVRCVIENSKTHGVDKIVEARVSDMFSAIGPNEKFDVITMNPPFTDHDADDFAELTVWDGGRRVHYSFFADVDKHLNKHGRIYLCQASFGMLPEMLEWAWDAGFECRIIGKTHVDEERIFFAFELKKEAKY